MEAPAVVEDGTANISVADNLVGTSVTPPNLSVDADLAVAPYAAKVFRRVTLMARWQGRRMSGGRFISASGTAI